MTTKLVRIRRYSRKLVNENTLSVIDLWFSWVGALVLMVVFVLYWFPEYKFYCTGGFWFAIMLESIASGCRAIYYAREIKNANKSR